MGRAGNTRQNQIAEAAGQDSQMQASQSLPPGVHIGVSCGPWECFLTVSSQQQSEQLLVTCWSLDQADVLVRYPAPVLCQLSPVQGSVAIQHRSTKLCPARNGSTSR